MIQYVYKIKNKDGLYSSGQSKIRWIEDGKSWTSLRNLRMHLKYLENIISRDSEDYPYHGCSIVRFKIEEDEVLEVIK